MKKVIAIMLALSVCLCVFSAVLPSFALSNADFTYEIIDDSAVITGYTGSATAVTVPAQIDGLNVSKINDFAFQGNTKITSLTVSEGVSDIGSSAFQDCTALETISLPDTIIHIGENAIYNTAYYNDETNWKIKKTQTGSSSENIGVGSGNGDGQILWEDISAQVLEYLYLDKNLIKVKLEGSYSVKYGTLVIADGAFAGNKKAIDVSLPKSIVAIGCNAFAGCESLKNIRNLNYAKYIGDNAFANCFALEEFDLSPSVEVKSNAFTNTGLCNNPANLVNGGINVDSALVATNPENGEVVVNDTTTRIIEGAINTANVFIPANVIDIHKNAITDKENSIIFGYQNTTAHAYATLYSIRFVDLDNLLMGDVDFDGVITSADLQILYDVSATKMIANYGISLVGDLSEDGTIDGFDCIILDLILSEMEPSKLRGDVNGDRVVDIADYTLLCKIVSTTAKITDNYMFNRSDLNGDGAVDGFDAVELDLILKGYIV